MPLICPYIICERYMTLPRLYAPSNVVSTGLVQLPISQLGQKNLENQSYQILMHTPNHVNQNTSPIKYIQQNKHMMNGGGRINNTINIITGECNWGDRGGAIICWTGEEGEATINIICGRNIAKCYYRRVDYYATIHGNMQQINWNNTQQQL